MIRIEGLFAGIFLIAGSAQLAHATARAVHESAVETPVVTDTPAVAEPAITEPAVTEPAISPAVPGEEAGTGSLSDDPAAIALRARIDALPAEGTAAEIKERAVLSQFYQARGDAPLWVGTEGLNAKAKAIVAELGKARDWGLDPDAFELPAIAKDDSAKDDSAKDDSAKELAPDAVAEADLALTLAALKYARHARGGRITDPTILLNSNLDRKPQLVDPEVVLKGLAEPDDPAAYLTGLNPKHPQFERLRQAYLKTKSAAMAAKLLANMEEWRWMPEDLGALHILANVPEYMVYLVKDGKPIHAERIVVGEVGKQTTIFTRNLKTIVFKPLWRVPESIKVRELLPNLRRGGSMFRQYDLQLETKDGQPLDYREIDWNTADIRDYEVVQPPGRKNVMGVVKFTFPSQHTIFMHDTVDKWMFAQRRRTLSHGCLRLRNPMKMAELVLAEDKGWDAERVEAAMREGPRNNEIVIDKKIPVHLVYFTAWVDDDGRVRSFSDIYGHEKRITQALQGKWSEINVGRNHLAPVVPADAENFTASTAAPAPRARRKSEKTIIDMVGNALGGGF